MREIGETMSVVARKFTALTLPRYQSRMQYLFCRGCAAAAGVGGVACLAGEPLPHAPCIAPHAWPPHIAGAPAPRIAMSRRHH
jgi:hypothetical protein